MRVSYGIGHTLFKAMAYHMLDYRVIGRERLHQAKAALLVCNHASYVDPPIVGVAFDEEIYFLARKTLMSNRLAEMVYRSWNSIPVDQEKPDMSSLKTVIRLLKEGEKVLVFPEGTRSPDGNLQEGQPGVGLIVAKAQVPVIPLRLFGTYEAMPPGSSRIHCSPVTLVVGEEWNYNPANYTAKGKELYEAITRDLMTEIGKLQMPNDAED